jgi:uncharacterized protein involved in exopolysaccharide biosynthesis
MTLAQSPSNLSHPAPPNSRAGESQAFSWLELGAVLLRWRRTIVIAPLVTGLMVVAVTLLAPKKYTTTLSFTPVASGPAGLSAGALASLAGQFGVALPTTEPSSSPEFYAYLMRSDGVARDLVESRYTINVEGDSVVGTIIDLYEIDEGTPGKTLFEAMRVLRTKIITISFDSRTSIVSAEIRSKWPDLSLEIASRLLQLVDSFNLQSRQSLAGLESRFLVGRLDTARAELRAAENAQQEFLLRNRSYERDPVLLFEHNRLQRELATRQDVFSVLTQSYEQARLAAVHNTPTVSLVERPRLALRFDRRHTLPKLLAGMFTGFVLALGYILLVDSLARVRLQAPDSYSRFVGLAGDAANDLKSVLSTFRKRGVETR